MAEGWQGPRYLAWQAACLRLGSGEFSLPAARPLHPRPPDRHLSWFEAGRYALGGCPGLPSEASGEAVPVPKSSQQGRMAGRAIAKLDGLLWHWTAVPTAPTRASSQRPVRGRK